MNTHADKTRENQNHSVENGASQLQSSGESIFQFVDNRPEAVAQRKRQELVNHSPRAIQLKAFQDQADHSFQVQRATQLQSIATNHSAQQHQPIQRKENNTGLPDNLKTGMENLSGMSLDDVKVHKNSDNPTQLHAHAYAQGTDIHLAPGQEQHLPHEAWHVVQQKQGRVKPSLQMMASQTEKSGAKVNLNDDPGLEHEADVMGEKALQLASFEHGAYPKNTQVKLEAAQLGNAPVQQKKISGSNKNHPIQMVKEAEFVADPEDFMSKNVILFEYGKGFALKFPKTISAIKERIPENNLVANVKLLMAKHKDLISFYLQDSGTSSKDDRKVYFTTPALGLLPDLEIKSIFKNGDTFLDNADELVEILKAEDGGGENIRANYAPYMIGNPNAQPDGSLDTDSFGNVGSTVVDPAVTKFVFTDAMNGCAYAITKVDGSDTKFEAWHFQSETDNFKQASHFRAIKGIRDWFGVNDYYIGDGTTNLAATNIIWNSDGGTKMLSQKNVIALDGVGKTEFLESTSQNLNVTEDISEKRLGEVHDKLKAGARKKIDPAEILKINQQIQSLTIAEATANANMSMGKINAESDSMAKAEIDEINRISDSFDKCKGDYTTADLGNEAILLGRKKQELTGIASVGYFSTSYIKNEVKPLKERFLSASRGLLAEVTACVVSAKKVEVSTKPEELNEDLVKTLLKIKFHLDLYEAYSGDFRVLEKIIVNLNSLSKSKKAVATKDDLLSKEKSKLFPRNNL